MSAGHHHKRPNERHVSELKKILEEPTAAAMVARPPRIVTQFDTPYTGGYPVIGNWRQIDPVFVKAVMQGRIQVPGMTPQDILHAIYLHEFTERVILDADNDITDYEDAHEFATAAEHAFVRGKGAKPVAYERAIKPMILVVMRKPIVNVHKGMSCVPMRDHEDKEDAVILKRLEELGVEDAPKEAQASADYSRSISKDKCVNCKAFMGTRQIIQDPRVPFANLAPCRKIDGAVRTTWWCKRYEAYDGKAQGGNAQQAQQLDVRPTGGAQVPNAGQIPRSQRQGPSNPAGAQGQPVGGLGGQNQGQGQPNPGGVTNA